MIMTKKQKKRKINVLLDIGITSLDYNYSNSNQTSFNGLLVYSFNCLHILPAVMQTEQIHTAISYCGEFRIQVLR